MTKKENEYLPIKEKTLLAKISLPFSLYVKVNDKYLCYVEKSYEILPEQLKRFKDGSGARRWFVLKEDFFDYLGYLEKAFLENPEVSLILQEEELNLFNQALKEDNFPLLEACYQRQLNRAKNMIMLIAKDGGIDSSGRSFLAKAFDLKQDCHLVSDHCLRVSGLCGRLSFLMGKRGIGLENIVTAALIHDVGLFSLSPNELQKVFLQDVSEMNEHEKNLYLFHPLDSVEALSKIPKCSGDVVLLVKRHEERLGGEGYPEKLKVIDEQVQILGACNTFDKLFMKAGKSAQVALQKLFTEHLGHYDLEILNKLKKVLIMEKIV